MNTSQKTKGGQGPRFAELLGMQQEMNLICWCEPVVIAYYEKQLVTVLFVSIHCLNEYLLTFLLWYFINQGRVLFAADFSLCVQLLDSVVTFCLLT